MKFSRQFFSWCESRISDACSLTEKCIGFAIFAKPIMAIGRSFDTNAFSLESTFAVKTFL